MKTVYKYELELRADVVTGLTLPKDAEILTINFQEGVPKPQLWALVDTTQPAEKRYIEALMTGEHWEGPGELKYIVTRQRSGIVVHFFERVDLRR